MKLYTVIFVLLSDLVLAVPTPALGGDVTKVLGKRASVTDVANIGYATQSGG